MQKKIHYQTDILEYFIPVSLDRLISDLLNSNLLSTDNQTQFKQFCSSYIALFHAQAYAQLQNIKRIYRPFNPDRDSLIVNKEETIKQLSHFKSELFSVLNNANFKKLSENELNEALNKISPHGVKVSVDFDEFAEVALYYRGAAIHTELRNNWKRFQFKKQAVDMQIYRRLFVLLQPKKRQQWIEELTDKQKISHKKAEKKVDAAFKTLGISGEEDAVYMKLFKDIPRADLEMLFPNTRIQIRLFDKIKLGIMGGGGTAGGVMATISKFSAAIDPVSALIAIGGLLGVLWRQISKIFSQRAKYSAILTKNLYFYSLDNNMGVLTFLADAAETEECKEAILAYFFLIADGACHYDVLDKRIEAYLYKQYTIPMDFEINDSLDKLKTTELISRSDDVINAAPLAEANSLLKRQWNCIIENNNNNK